MGRNARDGLVSYKMNERGRKRMSNSRLQVCFVTGSYLQQSPNMDDKEQRLVWGGGECNGNEDKTQNRAVVADGDGGERERERVKTVIQ